MQVAILLVLIILNILFSYKNYVFKNYKLALLNGFTAIYIIIGLIYLIKTNI